jgi:hypothetical protein
MPKFVAWWHHAEARDHDRFQGGLYFKREGLYPANAPVQLCTVRTGKSTST